MPYWSRFIFFRFLFILAYWYSICSALDAESEFLVQDALEKLMVDRTVLTIAHRLSTIMAADNIVVIDEGKVVESGSYEDLYSLQDGLFRKLVERQTYAK